jgi:hypothetical protein
VRVQRVPMPEGGAEREAYWTQFHNCEPGRALKRADRKAFQFTDELMFTVGSHGEGMPANTPFPVESVEPCGACGEYVRQWFEWAAPRIVLL